MKKIILSEQVLEQEEIDNNCISRRYASYLRLIVRFPCKNNDSIHCYHIEDIIAPLFKYTGPVDKEDFTVLMPN